MFDSFVEVCVIFGASMLSYIVINHLYVKKNIDMNIAKSLNSGCLGADLEFILISISAFK